MQCWGCAESGNTRGFSLLLLFSGLDFVPARTFPNSRRELPGHVGPGTRGLPTLWLPSRGQCRWDQVQVQRLHLEGQAPQALLFLFLQPEQMRTIKLWFVGFRFSPAALKRFPGASTLMIMATLLPHPMKPPVVWQLTSFETKSIGAAVARTPQILTCCTSASSTTAVTCCSSRCVLFRSCGLTCIHFLLIETFTPHVDLGSSHRSLWGSSATVSACNPRDWREQEAL